MVVLFAERARSLGKFKQCLEPASLILGNLFDDLFGETHLEFIRKNGSLKNLIVREQRYKSVFDRDNLELLQSQEFENLVSHHTLITNNILNLYKRETIPLINQIIQQTKP